MLGTHDPGGLAPGDWSWLRVRTLPGRVTIMMAAGQLDQILYVW